MAFEGIHIARSGIAASQRALDVIGDNIANVGTPGHSRRRVGQVSIERSGPSLQLGLGPTSAGVRITGVERVRDVVLDATVRAELANSAGAELTAQTLGRIETAMGPLHGGIGDALTAFWNSWDELSIDPTSMAARTQVLGAAENVSRLIGDAARGVSAVAAADRASAAIMIDEQNALLQDVARLNTEITALSVGGQDPNALLDQRDRHLDTLAQTLGAHVNTNEDGTVNVSVNGFEVVRQGAVDRLVLTGDPATLQTEAGHAVRPGGTIGGLLLESQRLREQVTGDLDAIATQLRDSVNTRHGLGYDVSGAAGGDLFAGVGASDLAVVTGFTAENLAASSSGEARDGNHALAMSALRDEGGPDGTIDEQVRGLVGRIGAAVATARSRAELNSGVLDDLRNQRSAVSGVNIDEELTMLLQFQRAYEASARVLTSMDEMLDVLINRTGLVGR